MPRTRPAKGQKNTQVQQDAADILEFLRKFPGKEFTRHDIARGSGVPDNHRIGPGVRRARVAAEHFGDRIENYALSRDPARHGAYTLRYIQAGKGDAYGARDAIRSSRMAITAMEDMRRACDFESRNRHSASPAGFGQVATAVGGCLSTVSSIQELNEQMWQTNNENLRLAKLVAELQAEREARSNNEGF